jgi:transcriptional regulator with XRE-family HTH domain
VSEAVFRARVARMGVVEPPATTEAAMEALLREGICASAASRWLAHDPAATETRDQLLQEAYQRLEECPSPATEWRGVRELLDDEALAGLLGISTPSLRRYARGERHCPDPIAARLHWLALVIDQLEGSYNAYGIRRWFQRPRAALGGQAPQERLTGDWDPDDDAVRAIFELAQSARLGMVAS